MRGNSGERERIIFQTASLLPSSAWRLVFTTSSSFTHVFFFFLKHFCLDQKIQWREEKLPELSVSAAPCFPLCNVSRVMRGEFEKVFLRGPSALILY